MKKLLAVILCLAMALSVVACSGSETAPIDGSEASSENPSNEVSPTDSEGSGTGSSSAEDPTPEAPVANLVMANDQKNDRLVVYDLDRYEEGDALDDLEVWSVKTGHAAGLKFREDTVFGDVVVVGGTRSSIFEYPSGKELWGTDNPGNNTHSVEILPSGNLVLANSSGNNLRLFKTSALLENKKAVANTFTDYELKSAHGVLWDPEYEVLWALGSKELVAYRVIGKGTGEKLVKVSSYSVTLPSGKTGGHDLSPDYTDTQYLYLTVSSFVLRFDKETGKLTEDFNHASKLNASGVKGFSNNPNGNFFYSGPTGGAGTDWKDWSKASWCTDTIYFCYMRGKHVMYRQTLVSKESAFYKVRAFCGQYQ